MASTNDGNQTITFHYQQEGRASGFNRLITNVIPYGVINGGELSLTNNTVQISPFNVVINTGSCAIHLETANSVEKALSNSLPYVIVRFNWEDNAENYADIECVAYGDILANDLVLGKIEFEGSNATKIDYTCKSWSSIYYENMFLNKNSSHQSMMMPNFHVYPVSVLNQGQYKFNISKGSAWIGGNFVELTESKTVTLSENQGSSYKNLYFRNTVSSNRVDLICLDDKGDAVYILGNDELSAKAPNAPSYLLPIATVNLSSTLGPISFIAGSYIKNIYNNNYIGLSPTFGKQEDGVTVNEHTLYI